MYFGVGGKEFGKGFEDSPRAKDPVVACLGVKTFGVLGRAEVVVEVAVRLAVKISKWGTSEVKHGHTLNVCGSGKRSGSWCIV